MSVVIVGSLLHFLWQGALIGAVMFATRAIAPLGSVVTRAASIAASSCAWLHCASASVRCRMSCCRMTASGSDTSAGIAWSLAPAEITI